MPYEKPESGNDEFSPETRVSWFKKTRVGTRPKTNPYAPVIRISTISWKGLLPELGYSKVLGLNGPVENRTLHLKKPKGTWTMARRHPHSLGLDDLLVSQYGSKALLTARFDYYQLVTEVVKDGVENITIRPLEKEGVEAGLKLTLVDFSMNGFLFKASPSSSAT